MHCLSPFIEMKTSHGRRLQSVPQCVYRNKNLPWPKITIRILNAIMPKMLFKKNHLKILRNAIKECYENASCKKMGLELPFKGNLHSYYRISLNRIKLC